MTMTPASGRVAPRSAEHSKRDLHPALFLLMGFALLGGIAFGVHALFGLLH